MQKHKIKDAGRHAFWLVPIMTLILAYLYLAWEYRTLDLLWLPVHENGKWTMLKSIFSFEHFVREIPISLVTSLAVTGAFLCTVSLSEAIQETRLRSLRRISLLLGGLILVVALVSAMATTGTREFLNDFLQFRTREGEKVYGSHWRAHFLHLLSVLFVAPVLALFYRWTTGTPEKNRGRRPKLLWIGVTLFIIFSAVFIRSTDFLRETRILAHAFREIVTHLTVTLPLAFALLGWAEDRLGPSLWVPRKPDPSERLRIFGCAVAFVSIPVFILLRLSGRDILAVAQKQSNVLDLLASHYFEHALDYLFVPVLCLLWLTFAHSRRKVAY